MSDNTPTDDERRYMLATGLLPLRLQPPSQAFVPANVTGTYRQHCWFCEGRGQAPAWRTGLTHDSICPKCSGSGFADTTIETITAERDALARTLATLTAAGIVVGEDGTVRWHGLTGAEIEAMRRAVRASLQMYKAIPLDPDEPDCDSVKGVDGAIFAEWVDALDSCAAAAGRGADGEAGE